MYAEVIKVDEIEGVDFGGEYSAGVVFEANDTDEAIEQLFKETLSEWRSTIQA